MGYSIKHLTQMQKADCIKQSAHIYRFDSFLFGAIFPVQQLRVFRDLVFLGLG